MASHPVIDPSDLPRKPEELLRDLKEGWVKTAPAGRRVLVWGLEFNVMFKKLLSRIRNESRLRQAYRDLGEFLYAKRDSVRLDEADHVELDLLRGKIMELQEVQDRLSDNESGNDHEK